MYYETNVTISSSESGQSLPLNFQGSKANGFLIFIDGKLLGETNEHTQADGTVNFTLTIPSLTAGVHNLWILSETFGFNTGMGSNSSMKVKGLLGTITLGSINLASNNWIMRPYLAGELYNVYSSTGTNKVTWSTDYKSGGPLTWYQTTITKPSVPKGASLLLSGIGLNRGHYYINGYDLGRYWMILRNDGSNTPTQTYYRIPEDYLSDSGQNLFTILAVLPVEDITKIDLVTVQMVPSSTNLYDTGVQVCQI